MYRRTTNHQHLLFHGFVMFQNKCIGELSYESTAPAISMAAAFITFLLDLLGSRLAHKKHLGSPESPSLVGEKRRTSPVETSDDGCGHHDAAFAAEQNHQVLLLEAGILFHSIMIGVTLVGGKISAFQNSPDIPILLFSGRSPLGVERGEAQLTTTREPVPVTAGSRSLSSSSSTRSSKVPRESGPVP